MGGSGRGRLFREFGFRSCPFADKGDPDNNGEMVHELDHVFSRQKRGGMLKIIIFETLKEVRWK